MGYDNPLAKDTQPSRARNDSLYDYLDTNKQIEKQLADYHVELEMKGFDVKSALFKQLMADEEKHLKKMANLEKENYKTQQKLKYKEDKKQEKEKQKETKKLIVEEYKSRKKLLTDEELKIYKQQKKELHELERELAAEDAKTSEKERQKAYEDAIKHNKEIGKHVAGTLINGAFKAADAAMNEVMSSYARYQSSINVRLQGTSRTFQSLQKGLLDNVGITPYIKTQNMLNNLQALVESGVSFNLEQRAFLMSISDKIAATFDANNGTLRRIIRLQQEDSTAGRLGMEAYMTRFLNSMYENTEYLVDSFDTVTDALVEATSQMSTQMGVEFEYVVQKWLGSLSSVGLSSNTVSSIAQAIGYLASGDIESLGSSNMQNLLVMAASRAGLDYGSMLQGVTTQQINTLLGSLVSYMQEIGTSTSNVVKNQFAKTFGVSMSDIRAAGNLRTEDLNSISKNLLSYSGAITELGSQMGQISTRISLAEMLENVTENAKYSLFSNIAANPALYAL